MAKRFAVPEDLDPPGKATYSSAIEDLPCPPSEVLDCESWRAWCYFVRYRKRDKKKPLTKRAARMTFSRARKAGCTTPALFAMGLEEAEEKGWTAPYFSAAKRRNGRPRSAIPGPMDRGSVEGLRAVLRGGS